MGMSYRCAWLLTKTMNFWFSGAPRRSSQGRRRWWGCPARDDERKVLTLYRSMEEAAAAVAMPEMAELRKLMVDQPPED
jgi:molybdenum-dependent DNA-binding transcriptional regulator ModE